MTSSGFYTISFNTKVDAEQSPISNLKLVVRRQGTSWDNAEIINTVSEIDHRPSENDPHNFVSYLGPGNYYIAVKVEDNWGESTCSGLPGFNPGGGGTSPCRICCNNNLSGMEINSCGDCAIENFYNGTSGTLYTCPN